MEVRLVKPQLMTVLHAFLEAIALSQELQHLLESVMLVIFANWDLLLLDLMPQQPHL